MKDARVKEILRTKGAHVHWAPPDSTVAEVVRDLGERGVGALVVSSDGSSVLGIVSERDVVRALAAWGPPVLDEPVDTIMTSAVQTCTPDDAIGDVMARMTAGRFRHLPVVVDGVMVGVVSIGDAVKHRVGELEVETQQHLDYIHAR